MSDDDDDDDFEDLFSFGGASTPGGAPPSSSDPTKDRGQTPSSVDGDFDVLSDVSLSTTPGTSLSSSGGGGMPAPGRSTPGRSRTAAAGSGSGGGGGAAADEFDALFGTPPPTPATPRTPLNATADDRDALLAIDETPEGERVSSAEDFHVHDEDTRDMLDWLDDDEKAKPAKRANDENVAAPAAEEDDFDFDQMIAESRSAESGGSDRQTAPETERTTPSSEASRKQAGEDGKSSGGPADDGLIPVRRVASNIEEELALDQWEDDDEEGDEEEGEDVEDMQVASSTDVGALNEKKIGYDPTSAKKPTTPINFASLSEAIRSNSSTLDEVRRLFRREGGRLDVGDGGEGGDRAHLWTKVICGKVLKDLEDGSLADSYREWEKKALTTASSEGEEEHGVAAAVDALLKRAGGEDPEETNEEERRRLLSLCRFHSRRNNSAEPPPSSPASSSAKPRVDPLIPPVTLAVLGAGVPPAAASVALSQIEPSAMPLLRLSHGERYAAARALHADFYLLACYHLPLLVMHLDRHCPGWYWPRKGSSGHGSEDEKLAVGDNDEVAKEEEKEKQENADESKAQTKEEGPAEKSKPEEYGLVPLSWFVTIFAGECGGSCLDHKHLLPLWDDVLTKGDHSWKYFLAIAVLEKNSDVLLMSRGEELRQGLEKILDFQEMSFAEESFVGASEGAGGDDDEMVSEWLLSARSLVESTPSSVVELLRSADDRAVASAFRVRQTKVDRELQAQLDAHEAARKKEREERDRLEERELNRARLTAYYRTYNPEKVDTVDKIMKLFDGRMAVLNEKLKNKYGKGFLPDEALKDQTRSFFMSVNQSISETRKHVSVAVAERRKKNAKFTGHESRSQSTPVALEVSATEVIPIICTTKAHNLATGKKMSPARRTSDTVEALQFYLVDCRPESIAAEQGRFPTAVTLSPEKLQDPDELQKLTDMFESLRGAVHICVMGEGFASFPVLYNHTLSKVEEKLLQEDLARTSDCALFFLKKGFPFVSVLRGGFAAAHAFLSRNGPPLGMSPDEVLVDYDTVVSLFAQLETARQEEEEYKNAPAREKTARTLQKIIDNSMTRLTLEEQRINNLANDLAKPETVVKMKQSVSNFLAKPKTVPSISFGRTPPLFMSKKFAAASTKAKEESEKKTESTEDGEKAKPAASTFTERINLKMVSLHSDSSVTAVSDNGSGVDENDDAPGQEALSEPGASSNEAKRNDGAPKESVGSKISFASFASRIKQGTVTENPEGTEESSAEISPGITSSPDKENDGDVASDNTSKVSSAFASLTQRMQQSTTTVALDGKPPESESDNKGSTASKMSFSGFANRIKLGQRSGDQSTNSSDEAAEGEVSKEKEDTILEMSEEKETETEANSSDKPMDEGRFTKFTKSIGGTLAGLREPAADAKVSDETKDSTSEEDAEKDPKMGDTTSNHADGGRFTKFTKSFGGTFARLPESSVDVKVPKEKEDSAPENSGEEDSKAGDSAQGSVDGGRFAKFTKSIGGTIARLPKTAAADDKVYEETEDFIPQKSEDEKAKTAVSSDDHADGGRFTKFTKSLGGGLSGFGLMHSNAHLTDLKESSEGEEEPGALTRTVSDLGKSSMGKLLFEDEPRPKTRFQRLEEPEESISFGEDDDDDDDAEKTLSMVDSQEDIFADISLNDRSDGVAAEEEKTFQDVL